MRHLVNVSSDNNFLLDVMSIKRRPKNNHFSIALKVQSYLHQLTLAANADLAQSLFSNNFLCKPDLLSAICCRPSTSHRHVRRSSPRLAAVAEIYPCSDDAADLSCISVQTGFIGIVLQLLRSL